MSKCRLFDRQVDGLADRAAAVMEPGRRVGQLHEVAEVLDRAVAPAAVEVRHEGRPVVRREDHVRVAEDDVPLGVARVLRPHARRRGLDDRAGKPAREADPLAVDVGAARLQRRERVGVAAEVDADLLENRVGVPLEEREAFLVEHLVRGEGPGQERLVRRDGVRPQRLGGRRGRRCGDAGVSMVIGRPPRRRRRTGVPGVAGRDRARTAADGAGQIDDRERLVDGAVRCGRAIASTKCSWKRGSTAVSTFWT